MQADLEVSSTPNKAIAVQPMPVHQPMAVHPSTFPNDVPMRAEEKQGGVCCDSWSPFIFNFQMNALINDYEKASSNCYGDDFWATAVTDQTAVDHPLGWFEWRMALRRLRSASNVD